MPHVLVIEDDAPLTHLYCSALELHGLAVVRAGDGLSALRTIESRRPDVILLDLNLPVMDGWALLREVRANPTTSDIPIIVVTGVDPLPVLPDARMVLLPGTHVRSLEVDGRSHTLSVKAGDRRGRWNIALGRERFSVDAVDERTRASENCGRQ